MTDKIDDGGPAFPTKGPPRKIRTATSEYYEDENHGMSLRDWFAGQALAGICAHNDTWGLTDAPLAKAAYQIADAMLSARKGKP